jgi:hypothetical protein
MTRTLGVLVDPHCTKFDFTPAWKAGAAFGMAYMNWDYQKPVAGWIQENGVLQQSFEYNMPMVGIYNLNVNAYHQNIPDLGYYPLEDNVLLEDDKVWLDIKSLIQSKHVQVIVLRFFNFLNNDKKPIAGPHVFGIVSSAIERVRKYARTVNHNIQFVIPMIDERIIRDSYHDLGSVMAKEPYCCSDFITMKTVVRLNDWNKIDNYYPEGKLLGYDGQEHDNPPISFCMNWKFWVWAEFAAEKGLRTGFISPDFKRLSGDGVMGAAFFNGTPEKLFYLLEVSPTNPVPVPVPTPEPEPETPPIVCDELLENISAEILTIKKSILNIENLMKGKQQ